MNLSAPLFNENMKYKLIPFLVAIGLLLSTNFVGATPVSWDQTTGILQPLLSGQTSAVKIPYIVATSTATSTFAGGINLTGSGCLAQNGTCITGGGGVAGSNTNIQYNNNGAFGGSSNFTWDGSHFTVTGTATTTGQFNLNTTGYPQGIIGAYDASPNSNLEINSQSQGPFTSVGLKNNSNGGASGALVLDTQDSPAGLANPLIVDNILGNSTCLEIKGGSYGCLDDYNTFAALFAVIGPPWSVSGSEAGLTTTMQGQHGNDNTDFGIQQYGAATGIDAYQNYYSTSYAQQLGEPDFSFWEQANGNTSEATTAWHFAVATTSVTGPLSTTTVLCFGDVGTTTVNAFSNCSFTAATVNVVSSSSRQLALGVFSNWIATSTTLLSVYNNGNVQIPGSASTTQLTASGVIYTPQVTASGNFGLTSNGASLTWDGGEFYPNANGTKKLGLTTNAWNNLYANYASTTETDATTICLSGTCRTSWPTSGASTTLLIDNNTFSGNTTFTASTTFQSQINAQQASTTNVTASGVVYTPQLTASGNLGFTSNSSSLTWDGGEFYPNANGTKSLGLLTNEWVSSFVSGTASSTNVVVSSLGTPAGTFLAADPTGKIIATSTATLRAASSTLLIDNNTFSGTNMFTASTTIGNSAQNGGLTINGGATTTGNAVFSGTVSATGLTKAPNFQVPATDGDGIGFFATLPSGAADYGIYMSGNSSGYYGDVADHYIANNMSAGITRGFVWQYQGGKPTMSFNPNDGVLVVNNKVSVGSTTPGAMLSDAGLSGATVPLALFSTSTAAFATTTVFAIDQNGNTTIGNNGSVLTVNGATTTAANGLNILTGCFSVNGTCIVTGGTGPATSTNPLMATYFVGTSTTQASTFPEASTTILSASGALYTPQITASGNMGFTSNGGSLTWDGGELYPNSNNTKSLGLTTNEWRNLFTDYASTTVLEMTEYAENFAGADIGAQVNAAYAALPSYGGEIHIPAGAYSFSTQIAFTTSGKNVNLVCDGANSATLTWIGTATSTVFNSVNVGAGQFPSNYGEKNCNLLGNGNAGQIGMQIGGSNGAPNIVISGMHISGFAKQGIVTAQNTWIPTFQNDKIENNGQAVFIESANNSGENFRFIDSSIGSCSSASVNKCFYSSVNGTASMEFDNDSFNDGQIYLEDGNANWSIHGGHMENPAFNTDNNDAGYTYIVTNSGGFTNGIIDGMEFANDATTTAKSPYQYISNGGMLNVTSATIQSFNHITSPTFVQNIGSNASLQYSGIKNIFNVANSVNTIATSSVEFGVNVDGVGHAQGTIVSGLPFDGLTVNAASGNEDSQNINFGLIVNSGNNVMQSNDDPVFNPSNASSYPFSIENPNSTNASSTGLSFQVSNAGFDGAVGAGLIFTREGGGSFGHLTEYYQNSNNAVLPSTTWASNGYFGVGSTTPWAALSVVATSSYTGFPEFVVASSTSGTAANINFEVDSKGHLTASSSAPTISSCGTTPNGLVDGTDDGGFVTVGGTATGCTITFNQPYPKRPECVLTNQSLSITSALTYTVSATAIVVSQAVGLSGDILDYQCGIGI